MVATNTTAKKPAKTTRQTKSAEKIAQSTEQKLVQLLADTPVQIFPYSRLSHTGLNTRIIPHTDQEVEEMADSIQAMGILQNLIGAELPDGTIGIVGGLIIGQAAVDASLVSPIVVIVVAFTALCSFAIPNEEFASAFRILKYGCIFMGAWLGLYGVALSGLWVLIHLSHLNSFGIPYLMPYVAADVNGYEDKKDSLFRFPLKYCVRRPIFARRGERIKLRKRD